MNKIICTIQQSYYRLYDIIHYPKDAFAVLKYCIEKRIIKEYWSWLETSIVSKSINQDDLIDDSEIDIGENYYDNWNYAKGGSYEHN